MFFSPSPLLFAKSGVAGGPMPRWLPNGEATWTASNCYRTVFKNMPVGGTKLALLVATGSIAAYAMLHVSVGVLVANHTQPSTKATPVVALFPDSASYWAGGKVGDFTCGANCTAMSEDVSLTWAAGDGLVVNVDLYATGTYHFAAPTIDSLADAELWYGAGAKYNVATVTGFVKQLDLDAAGVIAIRKVA
jgi:hypothetical protein